MYYITANGVYRCCKYLVNVTFYTDENGWTGEAEEMRDFAYKNILKMLRSKYTAIKFGGCDNYDGEKLWVEFFLKNPVLSQKISLWKITGIDELHYKANEKANWR